MTNEWKIKHIFDPHHPKGGVTILYKANWLGNHGIEIEYKYAVCSVKDTYWRKEGIRIAENKPVIQCEILAERWGDITSTILHDIVSSSHGDNIKQSIKDIMADYLRFQLHREYSSTLGMIDFYFSKE